MDCVAMKFYVFVLWSNGNYMKDNNRSSKWIVNQKISRKRIINYIIFWCDNCEINHKD